MTRLRSGNCVWLISHIVELLIIIDKASLLCHIKQAIDSNLILIILSHFLRLFHLLLLCHILKLLLLLEIECLIRIETLLIEIQHLCLLHLIYIHELVFRCLVIVYFCAIFLRRMFMS